MTPPASGREPLRVLFVEDRPADAELCRIALRNAGFDVVADIVETREELTAKLRTGGYDVVLSDYGLQGWTGADALDLMHELGRDIPFILVTGSLGDEAAVDCVKLGAADYVIKDRLARLPVAVRQALARERLRHGQAEAARALKVSEQRYRSLVENSPDAILLMNDWRWTFANHAAARVFGAARREDLIGLPMLESVEPALRDEVRQRIERSASTGKINLPIERRLVRLDGALVDVDVVAIPIIEGVKGTAQIVFRDITQRKRAEELLKASETRFRALIENSMDLVTIMGADGRFKYSSPSVTRLLGYEPGELIGDVGFGFVHPDDATRVQAAFGATLQGETAAIRQTFRFRHKDGSWRAFESVVTNMVGEPTVAGVVINSRDITDRTRAEEELRASEQRLQSLFAGIDDAIFVHDQEGRIIDCNDAACRRLGYSREELLAMRTSDVDAPEFAEGFRDRLARQFESGRFVCEGVHLTKDGRRIPVDINSGVMDYQGRRVVLAAMRDSSERKRAEEALRRSEAEYRGLVEHATVGIYRSTPDGRLLTVNPAFVKMLGYGWAEEVLRLDVARDVYADPERWRELTAQTAQRDESGAETQWKRKDGSLITVRVNVRAVRDPGGQVEYHAGLVEDVTEQRNLEMQFRQSQRLEAVGTLAGGVAHDFNNVLTAITGYSDLLLEDMGPQDPKREDLLEIRAAAQRAAALTRQLLAFSRKQVLQTRVLDLNEVVRALEKMLQRLIGEDVKLECALADGLGATQADPGQLEQVILNLAVNSRDAMPGGGRITIETTNVVLGDDYVRAHTGAAAGRYVMLALSDTGTGMDAETQAHIFEPFFTTKEQGKGTGLGLATVYGIVKQSGGHVWVYSEVGRGTTFKIYLPQVDAPVEVPDLPASTQPVAGGRETILVAEDDAAVRDIVTGVLAHKGYQVLRAPEGQTALEIARAHGGAIHLLVTDLVMPGMSGRELAEALVAARPGIRVLYMSGYTDDAVVRHGVLADGMPYLQKPFTPDALAAKVREVCDRPAQRPVAADAGGNAGA